MRSSLPRFTFLSALALLVTATSVAQAQDPQVLRPQEGPAIGNNQSEAHSINDRGEIAGNSLLEGPPGGAPLRPF